MAKEAAKTAAESGSGGNSQSDSKSRHLGAQSMTLDEQFDAGVARIARRFEDERARKQMWLAHHWPEDYRKKCIQVGGRGDQTGRHICRRCAALYPVGFLVAFLAAFGFPIWPNSLDPTAIWILCLPATIAFVGEAVGSFSYSPRWQVAMMLVSATAFGKALSYELLDRWSEEFWAPLGFFGLVWFIASAFSESARRL